MFVDKIDDSKIP